jgi:hypothetical protein
MVSYRRESGALDMWLHEFTALPGDTLLFDLNEAVYALTPLPAGGTP